MVGTKRQYGAIDIARYVSALLVVAIHVYPFVDMSPVFNQYFIAIVCRLAVPFFFVVSGYFFFRKIRRNETEENREKLKDYLWRIGKIYLIWTVIYLPYTIWNYASVGFSWQSIFSWVRDFFLNGSYYHLWFLPAMMLGMAIVWFLYEKRGMMFTLKVSLGLYVVGYLINIYAPYWETLPYVSILYGFFQKTLVTARDGFFFAPMFLSLGLLLAKTRRVRARAAGTAFAISMVLLVGEVAIYGKLGILEDLSCMFLMLIPAVFFLVDWLLVLRVPWNPGYRTLRQDSLLIYTSHILFARILLMILPGAHLAVYFLTLACAQGFAFLVTTNMKRWPILRNLV